MLYCLVITGIIFKVLKERFAMVAPDVEIEDGKGYYSHFYVASSEIVDCGLKFGAESSHAV